MASCVTAVSYFSGFGDDVMTMSGFDRRGFLGGMIGASAFLAGRVALGDEMMKEINELKPGEFTWHPERAATGPVSVVVSIPQQRVHVYRNGIRIAVSTCSTGKPGHETPTGVFVVLQKDKNHRSSTYNDAPMPNMNRLTWSGIALHAGNLPGYPASHGCVRLPLKFSELLFPVTHMGTPVIIAGAHTDPWQLTHPGMVLSGYAEQEFEQVLSGLDGKKHPSDWAEAENFPVTSIIVSSADRAIELIENDHVIAKSNLILKGGDKLGSHVFVLNGADQASHGMHWSAITHHHEDVPIARDEDVIQRIGADQSFVSVMRERMHPGMTMVLTDAPLSPDSRSGKDFVIVTTG
jgi:hypothetical protein